MKTNINIPNSYFLCFSQTLNTNQIGSLKPKTLLKTCFKHFRNQKFFSLKILAKNPREWGLYRPNQKLAVRLICQSDRPPVDRQRSKIRPLEQTGRPPGRPKNTESRLLCSGRPARSTAHCASSVHKSVHVGRPIRSTDFSPSRLVS